MRNTAVGGVVLPALSGAMAALAVLGLVEVTRAPQASPPAGPAEAVQVVQVAGASPGETPEESESASSESASSESASSESQSSESASSESSDSSTPSASRDPGWPVQPGTGGQFVSLTTHERQVIEPDRYTQLRFEGEQTDKPGWHSEGDALIVPTRTAVAQVCYKVTWADDARPSQYYAQIARDPNRDIDVTGAQDAANTLGRDYRALCWAMKVRQGQPLAIRVKHDGSRATAVAFAEFKVWVP